MGALLRSFSGHMNSVYAVDFSPDGKSVRAPFRGLGLLPFLFLFRIRIDAANVERPRRTTVAA